MSGGIFTAYCWTHSTHSLPSLPRPHQVHPGVGPHNHNQAGVVHYSFYQWVGLALFAQSFTFYLPHWLWKAAEGRRLERLAAGLRPVLYRC